MQCPACVHGNPESAKFCNECGAALVSAPGHRARQPLDYTPRHLADRVFRTRSAVEGERKQVTVLFADLVGSLEHARHFDPEEWHRVLDHFFEILTDGVHRYEGTINQYTGDGIMALFGAPLAHEDHAQRACHAALHVAASLRAYAPEFQRRHGRAFAVRMGLNAGEVVVGRIGDDLRMDYTAQGHVVGVAARVEEAAEPGRVLVTGSVYDLCRGYFEMRPEGSRELTGVGPVRLFSLEGVGPAHTRLEREGVRGFSPFVGRVRPMVSLERALDRARSGDGLVVAVEGEPGVGKSRLCLEFAERCRQRGVALWEVHCPSHGTAVPRMAFRSLLRSVLSLSEDAPAEEARAQLASACEGIADAPVQRALEELFGVAEPGAPARPPTDAERDERLGAFLARLVAARTRDGAAVLVVDDLHWIDAESERLIAPLAGAVRGMRALLLVNHRPDHRAAWLDGAGAQRLGLGPLGPEACEELLAELVGDAPSLADLARRIRETAAGNPFFIEELIRSLAESGALAGEGGAYRGTPPETLEIPQSIRQVLAARVDRLGDVDKALLQVASVIGRHFELRVLAHVAPLPEAELAAALGRLEGAGFVRREPYRRGGYAFHHPMTQEVAYHSLLHGRRQGLHRAVARALEDTVERLGERASLVAHHWEEAGDGAEARRWRMRAGFRVANLVPRRRLFGHGESGRS